jgi:hypothetical protein
MRGLVPAALAALCFAVPALAADQPTTKNLGCGAGKVVLAVKYHVANDVDTGVDGNNWAFDGYARALRVVHTAGNRYCSGSTYNGMFTSIAGQSPGGRATIPAGIRGTFKGSSVTTFRATFVPDGKRTRGDLGTKDFQCTSADTKGRCAGTWDWLSAYFTSADNFATFKYTRYSFQYHAVSGGKGTYGDSLAGGKVHTRGDITAKKKPPK